MSSLETWPQKFADFALVSNDGKVLHCHKARLVENSEFFDKMLSHEVIEATNNRMDVPDYDGVTVASFLEWIYAAKPTPLGMMMKKLMKNAWRGEFISQRDYDVKKFSPGIFTAFRREK